MNQKTQTTEVGKLQQEFTDVAISLFDERVSEGQRAKKSEEAERLYNQIVARDGEVPSYEKVRELAQNKLGDDCADNLTGLPCSFWTGDESLSAG